MNFSDQLKQMTAELADRISHIEDTTNLLPYTVFCEEVNDQGNPCYPVYQLLKILPDGKCILQSPNGDQKEEQRDLTEINPEWLISIWERHCELLPDDVNPELLYLANSAQWADRAINLLEEMDLGSHDDRLEFVSMYWQNLRSDNENIEEYRQHLTEIGWEPEKTKLLQVFVWHRKYMERNSTDQQLITAWENEENYPEVDEMCVYTPDEFAVLINDEMFDEQAYYVRFIEY